MFEDDAANEFKAVNAEFEAEGLAQSNIGHTDRGRHRRPLFVAVIELSLIWV